MKQEDKDLLLKDLCGRLPYGVKVLHEDEVFNIDYISSMYEEIHLDIIDNYTIDVSEVMPYLFPISSMTEEQKTSHNFLKHSAYASPTKLIDFYNKNHIDYRGLIPMGLAINATGLNIY